MHMLYMKIHNGNEQSMNRCSPRISLQATWLRMAKWAQKPDSAFAAFEQTTALAGHISVYDDDGNDPCGVRVLFMTCSNPQSNSMRCPGFIHDLLKPSK